MGSIDHVQTLFKHLLRCLNKVCTWSILVYVIGYLEYVLAMTKTDSDFCFFFPFCIFNVHISSCLVEHLLTMADLEKKNIPYLCPALMIIFPFL